MKASSKNQKNSEIRNNTHQERVTYEIKEQAATSSNSHSTAVQSTPGTLQVQSPDPRISEHESLDGSTSV